MSKYEDFSVHNLISHIHKNTDLPLPSSARRLALELLNRSSDFDNRNGKAVEENSADAYVFLDVHDLAGVQKHSDFRSWVVLRATYPNIKTARFHLLPNRTSAEFYAHFNISRKENGTELVSTDASAPSS